MNIFNKIYCRISQFIFKCAIPLLPYREPRILDTVMAISSILGQKHISSVLLVTDTGIMNAKLTQELQKDLRESKIKIAIYDQVVPNPTTENVEEALELYKSKKCEAIIAFGGGSVMDCAKAVGARIANPKKSIEKMKGLFKVGKDLPPLFAIPTTAGTGSETTVTAVITDSRTKHKYTINDFHLIPHYAVLDETLTLGLPKGLTATTGLDALTHAIEAYIGNSTTKFTRHQALEAMRLIFENIEKVYDDGSNERSRKYMLQASYKAGLAFTRSYVGYVHAIAHSLGGKYNTPHGLANAVILPYVLIEYGKSIHKKIYEIATYCNIAKSYDDIDTAVSKFINKIISLNEYLGIPKTFDFIIEKDIEDLAEKASKEANPLYPVPKLMSAKELEKIYYKIKS